MFTDQARDCTLCHSHTAAVCHAQRRAWSRPSTTRCTHTGSRSTASTGWRARCPEATAPPGCSRCVIHGHIFERDPQAQSTISSQSQLCSSSLRARYSIGQEPHPKLPLTIICHSPPAQFAAWPGVSRPATRMLLGQPPSCRATLDACRAEPPPSAAQMARALSAVRRSTSECGGSNPGLAREFALYPCCSLS